jgi:hypothetical protein
MSADEGAAPGAAPTVAAGRCANVVVMGSNGKRYDLGSPHSVLFPIRRWIYLWRRRKEFSRG